jgi:hypothetical protein
VARRGAAAECGRVQGAGQRLYRHGRASVRARRAWLHNMLPRCRACTQHAAGRRRAAARGHAALAPCHSHRLWLELPRAVWQRWLAVRDEEHVQAGVQPVVLLLHARLSSVAVVVVGVGRAACEGRASGVC